MIVIDPAPKLKALIAQLINYLVKLEMGHLSKYYTLNNEITEL